jgi:hypothetical protein
MGYYCLLPKCFILKLFSPTYKHYKSFLCSSGNYGATTFTITTFSIMILIILTFRITIKNVTLSILTYNARLCWMSQLSPTCWVSLFSVSLCRMSSRRNDHQEVLYRPILRLAWKDTPGTNALAYSVTRQTFYDISTRCQCYKTFFLCCWWWGQIS